MATPHYFPDDRVHFTWDAGNDPVVTIESGDTVVMTTRDVSDNQITPESDASVIATLDPTCTSAMSKKLQRKPEIR